MIGDLTGGPFGTGSLSRKIMNMSEHDVVVLTRDLPEHGLRAGDVGAVVHVYSNGKAYEVEFVTGSAT
jgi:hypothetical protein